MGEEHDSTKPRGGRKATGQLIRRKSGWYGRFWANVDGERIRVCRALGTQNKAAARRKLARLVAAEDASPEEARRGETFGEAAARIYEQRKLAIASADGEYRRIRLDALEIFGSKAIGEVRRGDVKDALEACRDAGRGVQTTTHLRNALRVYFAMLVDEEAINVNPADVKIPDFPADAYDDRPRTPLTDDELFTFLGHTDPRPAAHYQNGVRERQLASLLAICLGGLRTTELHGLTWERCDVEGLRFERFEIIRAKVKKKASRPGSNARARQRIECPELAPFLRWWWIRSGRPDRTAPVFPQRQASSAAKMDRVGKRRHLASYCREFRVDLKRAFGLERWERRPCRDGRVFGQWVPVVDEQDYTTRMREIFLGTDDRRPTVFHTWRNANAIRGFLRQRDRLVFEQVAEQTGHAGAAMAKHYARAALGYDRVPPELLPDVQTLYQILREWCRCDNIDVADVFGEKAPSMGSDHGSSGEMALPRRPDAPQLTGITLASSAAHADVVSGG